MAPVHSRHLLIFGVPAITVFLTYLWYRRKKLSSKKRDTAEMSPTKQSPDVDTPSRRINSSATTPNSNRTLCKRSKSGVESAPIDIINPSKLRATNSQPPVSDDDLDREIEKLNMGKYSRSNDTRKISSSSETTVVRTSFTLATKSTSVKAAASPVKKSAPEIVVEEKILTPAVNLNPTVEKNQNNNNTNSQNQNNRNQRDSANHSPADITASPSRSSVGSNSQDLQDGGSIPDNRSERSTDSGKGLSSASTSPALEISSAPEIAPLPVYPILEQNIPLLEQLIPILEQKLPILQLNTPTLLQDTSISEQDAPIFEQTIPIVEQNIPILQQHIPHYLIFEFLIPKTLVGKLIGKRGASVHNIKNKTGATVIVKEDYPLDDKCKIVMVEGTQSEIDSALKLIRNKFPVKKYSAITLEPINYFPEPQVPMAHLSLIEGMFNDTIISNLEAPDHFFVQQPTHPSYPKLECLNSMMNAWYSTAETPLFDNPGVMCLCVTWSEYGWVRAETVSIDPTTNSSWVKLLDYGGYRQVDNAALRKIKQDFTFLPFQASECYLANVRPPKETGWTQEAITWVAQRVFGKVLHIQIVNIYEKSYAVNCYLTDVSPAKLLSEALVELGFAEYISAEEEDEASGVTVA